MRARVFFLFFILLLNCSIGCDVAIQHPPVIKNMVACLNSLKDVSFTEHLFQLDSISSPVITFGKIIDQGSEPTVLSFLNEWDNSIYFYDYLSGKYIEKRTFPHSWPIQGYEIQKDTLLLYSYDREELMLIFGDNSRTLQITREQNNGNSLLLMPFLMTRSPIILCKNGQIVMPLFSPGAIRLEDEKKRKAIRLLDSKSEIFRDCVLFPEYAMEMNWGGGLTYLQPYIEQGPSGNIVISFSFSHDIYEYILDSDELLSYYAGSGRINSISSFKTHSYRTVQDKSSLWEWYMRNPSYEGILYDKYRHCYYRFARLPYSEKESIPSFGNHKPVVIVVLDENFNYIGERCLKSDVPYNSFCSFVSPGGLMIQVDDGREDQLCFHEYSFNI
ncbi:MAG: DUF4221 domain-containing protein [Bacteroidales bacterium]|nr:DUF4221 domain-containing protein [Bacteroidales bacterium]